VRPFAADRPHAVPGQTVGLFGGSFDPPHAGHVHLTREALKRLGLDQVWWLVSPGNPLKTRQPAPLDARIAAARALLADPRVRITAIEADLGTRATADTLAALRSLYPGVRFVWLMGADNLAQFHRWDRWRQVMALAPIAVFARPGQRLPALTSRVARILADSRLPQHAARSLARSGTPTWIWLDIPMRADSSTALRGGGPRN
jgi:nicotinate-nucleotide adenylyltransferase